MIYKFRNLNGFKYNIPSWWHQTTNINNKLEFTLKAKRLLIIDSHLDLNSIKQGYYSGGTSILYKKKTIEFIITRNQNDRYKKNRRRR